MSRFVSINNSILESVDARVPALSAAVIYGRSVFTSLAYAGGRPFLWDSHWQRLRDHCSALSIETDDISSAAVLNSIGKLISAGRIEQAKIRITLADTAPTNLWPYQSELPRTSVIVVAEPLHWNNLPARVDVSNTLVNTTSLLSGIKSGNYLEPISCRAKSRRRGFDESVRLNERGEVVSACLANLYWVVAGDVFTPPASSGCLPGTIRRFLIENHGVGERIATLADLESADELFLTSSGIGLRPAILDSGRSARKFPMAEGLSESLRAALCGG